MLKALQADERIEKILVLPDKIPPHKECDLLASDNARIQMCNIVCEDFNKCELCLVEFERAGRSYTYDTVIQLKKQYKNTEFEFVCGADMLVFFDKWYKYEELIKEIPFIVFRRSDVSEDEFLLNVKKYQDLGMKIFVKDEIIPSVSSTQIRKDFKKSEKLIPKKVYDFLFQRGIYNA